MTRSETTTENRNWFKVAALALLPTLIAGLVFILMNSGEATELAVEETTTTVAEEPTTTVEQSDWQEPESVPVDLPDYEPEALEENEEAEPMEEEEAEEPAPALPTPAELAVSESVGVDADGHGVIEISNLGESTLEIFTVDVNGNPIQMGEGASEMAGGTTQEVEFIVDTSELPIGEWEMTVSFYTNGGEGHVTISGHKWFVVHLIPPSLDISSAYIVPHQTNALNVTIVNNQNYNVTVALSTEDSRLTLPEQVELQPGENQVFVGIAALAVPHNVIDVLEFDVNWGETTLGTVTITKHGS